MVPVARPKPVMEEIMRGGQAILPVRTGGIACPALHRSSFLPEFIEVSFSFIGDRIDCVLDARTPLLHIAVTRHRDRRAVEEDRAAERQRDHHAVPGM